MNPIAAIIETLLDEHRDAGTHSNPELAAAIADKLTAASLQQLAALLGGTIDLDDDGQAVLYTGCYAGPPVPTQEELDAAVAFNRYEDADGHYTLLRRPATESHERMKRIARGEDDV